MMTLLGPPRQIDIRSIDGHNGDQVLAPLLRAAAQNGMPIVAANPSAVRLVNAATYPQNLLGTPFNAATTKYVAVVERTRFAHTVPDDFPYYQANGPWRQILKCRVSQALVLIFENENLPTADLGSPAEAGKRLHRSAWSLHPTRPSRPDPRPPWRPDSADICLQTSRRVMGAKSSPAIRFAAASSWIRHTVGGNRPLSADQDVSGSGPAQDRSGHIAVPRDDGPCVTRNSSRTPAKCRFCHHCGLHRRA